MIGQGPLAPPMDPANYPTTFDNYPSDFNSFGGSFPKNIWFWTPEQLAEYNGPDNVNRDPLTRADWNSMYIVEEKNAAAYVQADFQGTSWSANVGVRYVRTDENVVSFRLGGRYGSRCHHRFGIRHVQAIADRPHVQRLCCRAQTSSGISRRTSSRGSPSR